MLPSDYDKLYKESMKNVFKMYDYCHSCNYYKTWEAQQMTQDHGWSPDDDKIKNITWAQPSTPL